jgi:alkanesulfonate monooxygenase
LARRPRRGDALRYGLSAFVIARQTDAEAEAALARLLELSARDAPLRAVQKANTDPEVVMKHMMAKTARVGTNGGTAAGLVGSYDTVAARIAAFGASGIETFMLQFQPFEAEMRRFAEEVIPRVRDRERGFAARGAERAYG